MLIGGIVLWRTVSAHGLSSEMGSFLLMFAAVAAAIVFLPRVFPDGLPIRGYGVMLVAAAGAGIALATRRAEQMGIDRDVIFALAVWLFVGGILGARLFYVIEYWDERFRHSSPLVVLMRVLNFPEGGLVIYGGLIGGLAAFAWFVRRHRLPMLAMGDILAPSFMVGLALGRIGCLLNGCCYGGVSDVPWAITFPQRSAEDRFSAPFEDQVRHGDMYGFRLVANKQGRVVVARVDEGLPAAEAGLTANELVTAINGHAVENLQQAEQQLWAAFWSELPLALTTASGRQYTLPAVAISARSREVHPAQVYSAVNAALLAALLWNFYPFRRRDGEVMALMLTLYPISRFLLEMIRKDEAAMFGTGLSISQNISVAILLGMVGVWIWLWRSPRRLALNAAAE
jgi:phosphatidylglycerol:prolipoprotein diacylglycerol transferase